MTYTNSQNITYGALAIQALESSKGRKREMNVKDKNKQCMEWAKEFLNYFPDGKDIPRLEDGDIDFMVFQKFIRKHGIRLITCFKLIDFILEHPDYDRDAYFRGAAELINSGYGRLLDFVIS